MNGCRRFATLASRHGSSRSLGGGGEAPGGRRIESRAHQAGCSPRSRRIPFLSCRRTVCRAVRACRGRTSPPTRAPLAAPVADPGSECGRTRGQDRRGAWLVHDAVHRRGSPHSPRVARARLRVVRRTRVHVHSRTRRAITRELAASRGPRSCRTARAPPCDSQRGGAWSASRISRLGVVVGSTRGRVRRRSVDRPASTVGFLSRSSPPGAPARRCARQQV